MNGKLMTEKDKPKEKTDPVKKTEGEKTSPSNKSTTGQKAAKKKCRSMMVHHAIILKTATKLNYMAIAKTTILE